MHPIPRLIFHAVLKTVLSCRFCVLLALAISSVAQTALPTRAPDTHSLSVVVLDENGVAVPGARVQLQGASKIPPCETDLTGHCKLTGLSGAPWHIRVDKEGFYAADVPAVQDSGTLEVDVHHQEEVHENVNVVESVPAIDPAQVSSRTAQWHRHSGHPLSQHARLSLRAELHSGGHSRPGRAATRQRRGNVRNIGST